MKKLMVAVAAIAMAVAANASSFSWGISTGALDTKFAGAQAILFYGPSAGSISLPDTTGWNDKTTAFTVADLTGSGASQFRTGTIGNDGTFTAEAEDLPKIDNKTGSFKFYMAVITDDGKNVALVTTTKTARIASATTPAGPSWASTQFATFSVTGSDTPEPTSGLLLILGVAGLALRRKAK